mmetsp:Transcript_31474/g.66206  ORF Transcript_31474/g.66206 Transcript_31474/m.66206 type:complete len:529 (-) Transcript_31474:113-1699(-)
MIMVMTSGCCSRDDLFYSLVLFACSAKLWLTLNNVKQLRGPSIGHHDAAPQPRSPSLTSRQNHSRPPSVAFRKNGVQIMTKSSDDHLESSRRNRSSRTDDENDTESHPLEMRKRSMSEEERLLLMEKISLSDTILTRETSMDFHPKNSNWSHFENYKPSFAPPSPRKALDENAEEYFLWSEPPPLDCKETKDSTDTLPYADNSLQSKKYTRQKSTEDTLHFNAGCLPNKLIMIRHGQSEGNVDETLYATKPDNAMRLTKLGWDMARMAGKALREQLPPDESVHFIVSPYARTVETFHGIASAWSDPEDFAHIPNRSKRLKLWYTKLMEMGLTWHEDPRIREQDFGNYQDPQVIKKAKSERHKFGSFYYRFAHGESASDVFDRVSTFLDSLWRSFESGRAQNYVIVSHGISVRVFLTRYFRYSIDQFHMLANPKNCEMVTLAHDGLGRLKLDGRTELELSELEEEEIEGDNDGGERKGARANEKKDHVQKKKGSTTTTVVTGYKQYSRLRTLPPQHVRSRTVRMCYNDT